jgi:hypothetical protein
MIVNPVTKIALVLSAIQLFFRWWLPLFVEDSEHIVKTITAIALSAFSLALAAFLVQVSWP